MRQPALAGIGPAGPQAAGSAASAGGGPGSVIAAIVAGHCPRPGLPP